MPVLPPDAPPLEPSACPNCGALYTNPRPKFCSACGQESKVLPPTLREFAQQFGGAYLSTEGALWRTLMLLLCKPGELTRQYLAGRRKHYVLPLRLYLTISVLILLGVRLMQAVQVDVKVVDPPLALGGKRPDMSLSLWGDTSSLGLRDGAFYCDNLPGWICKRVQRRIDIDAKAMAGEIEQFKDRYIGDLGGAMFLLLPSFALWLKLAYLNRRMRYTEHLVFALHLHTFWFLALALILTNVWWLAALGGTAMPVYAYMAMRRVYGGRHWPRLLRAILVSMLYGVTLTIALTGVGLWALLA